MNGKRKTAGNFFTCVSVPGFVCDGHVIGHLLKRFKTTNIKLERSSFLHTEGKTNYRTSKRLRACQKLENDHAKHQGTCCKNHVQSWCHAAL